ncbi:MAG: HesA/MoeB/ThiF family protein [Pseudomonadota bacterium]
MLSDEELERYSRQIMLPGVGLGGQEKLKTARVLVVGAGGLGSLSCLYLAAAGVGNLVVADPDTVALSNLNRQILHATGDLGRPKTASAHSRLQELNPTIRLDCRQAVFASDTWDALTRDVDIIVDGTDNRRARRLLNRACLARKVPFVFGGVQELDGMVMTVIPGQGPCFECLFPGTDEPIAKGILGPVAGMIASIQSLEVIKLILGLGQSLAGRLIHIQGLAMRVREVRIHPNPSCQTCQGSVPRIG